MFTRYKGTEIPPNYSGTRFRDYSPPPTEMKTHKPSPSYVSTKTSVSPSFKSVQLQRENFEAPKKDFGSYEARKNDSFSFENEFEGEVGTENKLFEDDFYVNDGFSYNDVYEQGNEAYQQGAENGSAKKECDSCKSKDKCEHKKAEKCEQITDICGILDKIFKGIRSEDFLLLAIMLIIMGDGKSEAKGALLPLALILLYS